MGYISSGIFRKVKSGAPLRKFLASQSTLDEIIEFGELQLFAEATTYPIVLFLKKERPEPDATVWLRTSADLTEEKPSEPNPAPQGDETWVFTSTALQHVIRGWKGSRPLGECLNAEIYRGVTTGFNDAFMVTRATRDRLIRENPSSAEIIKPCLSGEDLRPWHQRDEDSHLIFTRRGTDIEAYPAVKEYLKQFRKYLEPRPADWSRGRWPGRKAGAYEWYEIQDSVGYYAAFENPRIHSTKVSLFPTFSFSEEVNYALNTSYVMPVEDCASGHYLLGVLNSRVSEFYCRKVFSPKANGYFEIQPGELSGFPIPDASDEEREAIGSLAAGITDEARARHTLHERTRRRIRSDLGSPEKKLNKKLTSWWGLDFPALRAETKKVFKKGIPLAERDEWEDWLEDRRAMHERRTAEIIRLETELNRRIYELFDLAPKEVEVIEEATKYRYGEV